MKRKLATLLLILPSTLSALACEFHGGFGMGSFGGFHPLAQQHMENSAPVELRVTHDNHLSVTAESDANLQLRYVIPDDYSNAEINLIPSDNLVIADSTPLNLSKDKGMIDVKFTATGPGEHFIMVRIDATQSYRPYSKIQRVNVTAI
ncbi:hypothetical protein [Paraglaciecola sp. 2405UD69-4]|uniref:hypothetical protein n=1 Tax=Paraglaciecola sp. 2405UD69-4 TaxID=3391836 RepID=UPI0039C998C0